MPHTASATSRSTIIGATCSSTREPNNDVSSRTDSEPVIIVGCSIPRETGQVIWARASGHFVFFTFWCASPSLSAPVEIEIEVFQLVPSGACQLPPGRRSAHARVADTHHRHRSRLFAHHNNDIDNDIFCHVSTLSVIRELRDSCQSGVPRVRTTVSNCSRAMLVCEHHSFLQHLGLGSLWFATHFRL